MWLAWVTSFIHAFKYFCHRHLQAGSASKRECFESSLPAFAGGSQEKLINLGHPLKLSLSPTHSQAGKMPHPISRVRTKGGETTSPHNESAERCLFLDTVSQPWDSLPGEITVWKGTGQLSGTSVPSGVPEEGRFWCLSDQISFQVVC